VLVGLFTSRRRSTLTARCLWDRPFCGTVCSRKRSSGEEIWGQSIEPRVLRRGWRRRELLFLLLPGSGDRWCASQVSSRPLRFVSG
jgi:hypothetical protein